MRYNHSVSLPHEFCTKRETHILIIILMLRELCNQVLEIKLFLMRTLLRILKGVLSLQQPLFVLMEIRDALVLQYSPENHVEALEEREGLLQLLRAMVDHHHC